jgi:hypothetical protein
MQEDFVFLGANLDTRPPEEQVKDVHFVEVVASAAGVDWKEKTQWRTFPAQFQGNSGSCVANTVKKLALISLWLKKNTFEIFSATSIYHYRSNKPGSGMIGVEAFDIWKNHGIALESMVPSEKMDDEEMDAVKIDPLDSHVAESFAINDSIGMAVRDFESVASVIQQTGKGVMVWFYFSFQEWAPKFPFIIEGLNLYASTTLRHSVTAVDFGLINGKKYIKIEDSYPFGGLSERWISEEFFQARNWFTRYPVNFKYDNQSPALPNNETNVLKPKHTFTNPLEFIPLDSQGNVFNLGKNEAQKADVIALQDILRYEGFFPTNVSSMGYYGALTAKAVYEWQKAHVVASIEELNSITPHGGRVGTKSITILNSIYA